VRKLALARLRIKGEIRGKEDFVLWPDPVEGKLIRQRQRTVGPNGKGKADISGERLLPREVTGKIEGPEKVQLWNSGGWAAKWTERLAIEEGPDAAKSNRARRSRAVARPQQETRHRAQARWEAH